MRRRRLIAVFLALALLGSAALWLWFDRLTPEERLIVGTWRLAPNPARETGTCVFDADRRCRFTQSREGQGGPQPSIAGSGRWSVRDGVMTLDWEDNPIRRLTRPVYRLLGRPTSAPISRVPTSITADELAFDQPDGTRRVWRRVPAD